MQHQPTDRPDDPRIFLERRILTSPFARVPFDYAAFFEGEEYRKFQRLTIGTMTATDMIGRVRYIDHSLWPYTEWELARAYLNWIFEEHQTPNQRRVGWNMQTWKLLAIHQPLFYGKKVHGDLAYLDISSAYWQIYNPLTLDVYFNPWRRAFGLGTMEFLCRDWLRGQRTVRNAIVGIARSREHHEYCPGARETRGAKRLTPESPWIIRRSYNKLLAPELWGFIAFTLHQVAADLLENFDISYVHTDGYILPLSQAEEAIDYVATKWGLSLAMKASGSGEVTGIGRWRIENQGTKNYGDGQPVSYVMDYDPAMQQRLQRSRQFALDLRAQDPPRPD